MINTDTAFTRQETVTSQLNSNERYDLGVQVETRYIDKQSSPEDNVYVFSYTITLVNSGTLPAKLLSRHWIIKNERDEITEVMGEGVVGEQPKIEPGMTYQYTSGAVIDTPVGTMEGTYQLIAEDGQYFKAHIAPFALAVPKALH